MPDKIFKAFIDDTVNNCAISKPKGNMATMNSPIMVFCGFLLGCFLAYSLVWILLLLLR